MALHSNGCYGDSNVAYFHNAHNLVCTVTIISSSPHTRTQYTTLSRRFKDVMEDYNGVQENYRDKNKDRIQKQLQYGTQNKLHHDTRVSITNC